MNRRLLVVRRLVLLLPILVTSHAVGCGAPKQAEEPASAPPPAQQPYPQPGYQYGQPSTTPGASGADGAAPPPPPPAPSPFPNRTGTTEQDLTTLEGALAAFEEEEIQLSEVLDDETIQLSNRAVCGRVCGALASMQRAADAICELAGKDDERCGSARDKLRSNVTRVNESGCTCS